MKDPLTAQEITAADLRREIAILEKRIAASKTEQEEVVYLTRKVRLEEQLEALMR